MPHRCYLLMVEMDPWPQSKVWTFQLSVLLRVPAGAQSQIIQPFHGPRFHPSRAPDIPFQVQYSPLQGSRSLQMLSCSQASKWDLLTHLLVLAQTTSLHYKQKYKPAGCDTNCPTLGLNINIFGGATKPAPMLVIWPLGLGEMVAVWVWGKPSSGKAGSGDTEEQLFQQGCPPLCDPGQSGRKHKQTMLSWEVVGHSSG